MQLNILDLFSGIGGFSLGLHNADPAFKTLAFCEIDPYSTKILNKNFKGIPVFNDVTTLDKSFLESKNIKNIDIITGGFPCQDLSYAGKKKGLEGKKSSLFYEIIRLANEIKPKFIIYENVPALIEKKDILNEFIEQNQKIGYDLQWHILRATAIGYPHRRKRAFVIAWDKETFTNSHLFGEIYYKSIKYQYNIKNKVSNRKEKTKNFIPLLDSYNRFPPSYLLHTNHRDIRGDNGLSEALDQIGALGNSLIPEIIEILGRALIQTLKEYNN